MKIFYFEGLRIYSYSSCMLLKKGCLETIQIKQKVMNHACPKTVYGIWGSLFKFTTHRPTLLLTAPISATNGIEGRHKKGSGLKKPCSVGLLSNLQYFGAVSRTSGQMVVDLKRDPHIPFSVLKKKGTLTLTCNGRYVKTRTY